MLTNDHLVERRSIESRRPAREFKVSGLGFLLQRLPFRCRRVRIVILHSSANMTLGDTPKTALKPFAALGLWRFFPCRTILREFRGLKWAI